MLSVFEVGKKYHYGPKGSTSKSFPIATCLYADREVVIMRWDGNRSVISRTPEQMVSDGFNEVVEPRKEYFNAYKSYNGRVHYGNSYGSEIEADKAIEGNNYYGRLIMTHHSETEVTVEFIVKGK